jgi:hypothetical protein
VSSRLWNARDAFDHAELLGQYSAYEKVRSDKSPETWLIIDYTSDKSNDFELTTTGTGDLAEFTNALVKPGNASFGYIRVK